MASEPEEYCFGTMRGGVGGGFTNGRGDDGADVDGLPPLDDGGSGKNVLGDLDSLLLNPLVGVPLAERSPS